MSIQFGLLYLIEIGCDWYGLVTEGHKKGEGCHQGVMGSNAWVGVTLGHEAE